MSRPGPTLWPALAAFAIGVVVLLLANAEALRVLAAVALLAGIALGTFAIATPEFTGDEDDETP